MVSTNNNKVQMTDLTVGQSLLRNGNNVGKAAWWAANAVGSFSKVLAVTTANSQIKAVRVIDDLNYGEIAEHGSNAGFDVIESISNAFGSSKPKAKPTSGYGSFGTK